jgi:acyl-lipid Delta6-acetylenase / acyl-lipid (9-3)-desaturase
VYDVSEWKGHPGGRVLYTVAGSDATDTFRAFHAAGTDKTLERFYVGDLAGTPPSLTPFELEYRAALAQLKAAGLFRASLGYYAWKFGSTTALLGASAAACASARSTAGVAGGALLLALFWQQCGWLAHDFAHNQVFRDRRLNDAAVLLIGNVYQGFSMGWWKNKHNTHHAIPNLHESSEAKHDGDPDIDTIPFLAWSVRLARKAAPGGESDSPATRWTLAHQAALYFPILLFARWTWAVESAKYAFSSAPASPLRYPVSERLGLLAHYAWVAALALYATGGSPAGALAFVAFAQCAGGILLAIPFGVGHNGMPVYDADKRPGFAELQVTTTRNVDEWAGTPLVGWFMGGLHLQVEHHLFPTVPRHNLAAVRAVIQPLAAKHGVPYRATSLWEGTREVLTHLDGIADVVKSFPAA